MTQNSDQTICSNCHSPMPSDLRFCRNCGFRLADSMGAYTGTGTVEAVTGTRPKRRRMSGLSWLFVGLLVFFIGAAAFTALVSPIRQGIHMATQPPVVKSYFGIDYDDSDQGLMLKSADVPGGPADKAGLVGGDIILSIDGQKVEKEKDIEDMMVKTPIGKTVDIEYLRDGEKKTTELTTVSLEESRRLNREFEHRPEGRGQFGYDDDDAERVAIPGTKISGVQLNTVLNSRPADMAGIKKGDIVVEFDGVPIRTEGEFLMRVRRALPYSTVKVVVMRGEGDVKEKIEIPVKMGRQ